jgi:hypothetical protein
MAQEAARQQPANLGIRRMDEPVRQQATTLITTLAAELGGAGDQGAAQLAAQVPALEYQGLDLLEIGGPNAAREDLDPDPER